MNLLGAPPILTSDEHFGHQNILRLCQRPFAGLREMADTIIDRHNSVKRTDDPRLTIHLGDMFWKTITLEDAVTILNKLHGRHAYVEGNHEEAFDLLPELRCFFVFREKKFSYKWNKKLVNLDHFSNRVWNKSHNGSWHLFGHSHGELPPLGLSFDVGVDGHDFYPWTMEQVAEKMATLKQHHVIPKDKLIPGTEAWNREYPGLQEPDVPMGKPKLVVLGDMHGDHPRMYCGPDCFGGSDF